MFFSCCFCFGQENHLRLKTKGDSCIKVGQPFIAKDYYQDALKYRPNDNYLKSKISSLDKFISNRNEKENCL